MVKKIGSIILLVWSALVIGSPRATLMLTDVNGVSLSRAGVDVPFCILVRVEGFDPQKAIRVIEVPGMSECQVQARPVFQSFYTNNGSHTTAQQDYQYVVRVAQEKTISFGPARVLVDGQEIKSNSLSVNVAAQQQTAQMQDNVAPAYVQLEVDRNRVYVGQAIEATITLYLLANVRYDSLALSPISNAAVKLAVPLPSGEKERDGHMYQTMQWRMAIYPHTAGELLIPALHADIYIERQKRSSRMFGFDFGWPMSGALEKKQIFSDAVRVTVDPLPATSERVDAVGLFESYKIWVDKLQANVHDGMVLTAQVVGQGDLDALVLPPLDLPESLRVYEDKVVVDQKSGRKTWSYVLQATEPGEHVIGEQAFTYFDPYAQQYVTHTTQPITLFIEDKIIEVVQEHDESLSPELQEKDIEPIVRFGQWYKIRERRMSDMWFMIWFMLPLCWLFLMFLIYLFKRYRNAHAREIAKRNAFSIARKMLAFYEQEGSAGALYNMFISLYAARTKQDEPAITQEEIIDYLVQAQMNKEKIDQWKSFFAVLAQLNFSKQKESELPLFARARYWLLELEKYL